MSGEQPEQNAPPNGIQPWASERAITVDAARAELQAARSASIELRSIIPPGIPPWLLLVLQRQEGINQTNTRMNAINMAGKLMLVSRIDHMQKELEQQLEFAAALQQQVVQQQEGIRALEASVAELEEHGEGLEREHRAMREEMEANKRQMELELEQHQVELEAQKLQLRESERVITQLKQLSVGQDFLIDSAILLTSLWVSSLSLVNLPLQLISSLIAIKRRNAIAIGQVLKLAVAWILARNARKIAKRFNLHSEMGSFRVYGALLTHYLKTKMIKFPNTTKHDGVG